ncbi:Ubiquitin carboxyl-terminal hydrolase 48 [Stylophora pistillata]|uniref:Ubiquitin carboxyl-terminal hydrolase 48 n=1 Tax=Stylophora pistillata TaxID=50429 RepID=A0A2B4S471_STYPI|nr:Ubiquitin carboxyl-terminal hydrolase 48 [Stylophora pistillata]
MARRTTNRKQQGNVLKQAWGWADYTEPENVIKDNVESAYRINTAACSQGNCRRNCKANPNCFNCLGERFWLSEIKDSYWLNCEDPENERRPENAFVGLKNLGATCYVNTFLQAGKFIVGQGCPPLAVNGLSTSEAIQSSPEHPEVTNHSSHNGETSNKPSKDSSEFSHGSSENRESLDKSLGVRTTPSKVSTVQQAPLLPSTTILDSDEAPTTVCGHLQLLFAQLQYSFRRYIDPSPFVDSLGLDTAQQQDAQEFSKLFTSLLEETFSNQAEPEVQNIVQSQFRGDYFYVTECLKCGNKSKRLSRFYELDLNIQGHSSLNQCIKEFLKEEKLDGDNQYYCTQCNSKQNAARYIELDSLPPVLNLQLLRFVFDRKTGYKKKLNSFIQFPDNLDMTEHVKNGGFGSNLEYELSAVLMHFGVSAYSGQYVAHIRDKKSGSWYKFNDEDIVKMQGKLKLSQDEDSTGDTDTSPKPAKRPKCAQGFHVSKNAYTLVYTLKGHKGADEDYEWISTKWLKDWMNEKTETPPVDNSSLLCSHGKLHPNQVLNAKRINVKAADEIFRNYGGLPRLQSDSLCIKCVKEQCRRIRFETRLTDDYKFVSDALKSQQSNSANFFWVGRRSLLRWKALANCEEETRQSLMDSCRVTANHETEDDDYDKAKENETSDASMTEDGGKQQKLDRDLQHTAEEEEEEEDETNSKFNEDLLCEHGGLSSDESCRRLVPDVVWQRLKYYFPSSSEFPAAHSACRACQADDEEERQKNELHKLLASEQRTAMSQLYLDRNRPSFDNCDSFVACAVSKDFIDRWRQFLRYPIRNIPPGRIINAPLLCPHEKFLFNPGCEDDVDGASEMHRKQRGEVSLTVGSSETLRDVKVQLMKSFSVMPIDQHLTLNGIPLTDNAATLRSLGIRPGSLLLLKVRNMRIPYDSYMAYHP